MAASSSSSWVGKISKGPQVFLNFRGKELGNGFVAHLEDALERAKINYFIYKHERVGTNLQNLFVRIEQSMVALVILSKEYTTSVWCLDELAKIKECMDKGSLIGIPIFYKLNTSVVSNLEGYFGDNFRKLKRNNQQDLLRTQKWEEALKSIPQTVGMKLSEESDQSDREFIKSIVDNVKSLLDDILMEENVGLKRQKVNSRPPQHQVFINFRGVDLRYGFVSHLVNALQTNYINVFIDNHEDRGQPIEILMDRIEESRIAVVIFSGRYTGSIWCLREVAKIKECLDKGTLIVIPIFYKVAPSTVRDLKGEFGDAFRNMASDDDERKEKWEEALMAIADLMGTVVNERSVDSDILERTVEDVMRALKRI